MLSTNDLTRPHLGMFALEPLRAALEFARLQFTSAEAPAQGDGHAVVLFPGLASDHRAMGSLAKYCERLGYTTHDWGRGYNTGPRGDVLEWMRVLAAEVGDVLRHEEKTVTLIGWSLGGLYAREIAKAIPGRVRQVITLGTPFARLANSTNVQWLFELLNGSRGGVDPSLARALRTPPPVPTTSIYSRSDGVVAWQACIGTPGASSENIEVESSHIGLVWHPEVLRIVGDRLAQPADRWRPYAQREIAA